MSEDKVTVDRKALLTILVQIDHALAKVEQLEKDIKTKR